MIRWLLRKFFGPKPVPVKSMYDNGDRISFRLVGCQTLGWKVEDWRLLVYAATTGTVTGLEVWLDGVRFYHTEMKRGRIIMNSGDVVAFDLVEILAQNTKGSK